jgi:2-keto-4-pentenoate hydratase/2-oxohepta-3-ene-1,7-dioic acid hydratase in catechol pathway
MRLVRYGETGAEKPGMLDDAGQLRDLSYVIADITPDQLDPIALDILRSIEPKTLPTVSGNPRLGAPVSGIGKMICIGLNYKDHADEVGKAPPDEPQIFNKAINSLCGPFDPIIRPKNSQKLDHEIELAIVFGSTCRYVSEADALNYVAGYATFNDISERRFQLEQGGGSTKGKSADNFAPLGPWLVTADAVPNPDNLAIWCEVNGVRYQDGTTSNLVFGVARCISYLSQFMTFLPGDVLATGTPAGVGHGAKPNPRYMQPGDVMRCGIEGLGDQEHTVVDYSGS